MLNANIHRVERGEQNVKVFMSQYRHRFPDTAHQYDELAQESNLQTVELYLRDKLTPFITLTSCYSSDAPLSFFADCARYQQAAVDALYLYACTRESKQVPASDLFDGIVSDEVLSTSSKQLLMQSVN